MNNRFSKLNLLERFVGKYVRKINKSPCFKYVNPSTLKVENVVSQPQNPIDKKTYKSEYCLLLFINHPKIIPIIKQPIKFAIKVDHGKLLLSVKKSFEIA